eukprot:2414361-Rhodomonas_salina.2
MPITRLLPRLRDSPPRTGSYGLVAAYPPSVPDTPQRARRTVAAFLYRRSAPSARASGHHHRPLSTDCVRDR